MAAGPTTALLELAAMPKVSEDRAAARGAFRTGDSVRGALSYDRFAGPGDGETADARNRGPDERSWKPAILGVGQSRLSIMAHWRPIERFEN